MTSARYWTDYYVENRRSVEDAIGMIKSGQRVFISSYCSEPQFLIRELGKRAKTFTDIEIVRLFSNESTPLSKMARESQAQNFNIRSFYLGSAKSKTFEDNRRFITPINLSDIPRLFNQKLLPIHVALIQVSPPDDFGWMSLGVSVDITLSAALNADIVIAQVNPKMPRVLGRSFLHVNDIDVFIEHEEDIITIGDYPEDPTAEMIAMHASKLIQNGSTMHISLGEAPQAVLLALSDKNDLGIHGQHLTDGIMHLVARGIVNNKMKGINEGKLIASCAIGTQHLYDFLDDNPSIEFHPSSYVNDINIISQNKKMVSFNVAMAIDLTGQVAADGMSFNNFSGVTGMLENIKGALRSDGGKAIIMLKSTSHKGKKSRIVPSLINTAVVVPRGDVEYIITEFGVVNLFGKSLQERAIALISIAHPDFRDELFEEAKKAGLIDSTRKQSDSLHGIYPLKLEETKMINGELVRFRPAKTVDERRIQEHYYSLEKKDVISRFFYEKKSFVHDEVDFTFDIDFIKDLTILGITGKSGFGKVIAAGEYLLDPNDNMAEVAFSVSKEWQGHKIAKILLKKLAKAARENGIKGLKAYTSPQNKGMIRLFHTLDYQVQTQYEDEFLVLKCTF
jgi:acyl-CoA hydrolase/RimJ/RimL family protein N-acetyltransferase